VNAPAIDRLLDNLDYAKFYAAHGSLGVRDSLYAIVPVAYQFNGEWRSSFVLPPEDFEVCTTAIREAVAEAEAAVV
jgi:hypothetical protein